MYTALRRSSSQAHSTTQLCSRIHTSTIHKKQNSPSRTRLAEVEDVVNPRTGRYRAKPSFERAAAPHQDPEVLQKHGRRLRHQRIERRLGDSGGLRKGRLQEQPQQDGFDRFVADRTPRAERLDEAERYRERRAEPQRGFWERIYPRGDEPGYSLRELKSQFQGATTEAPTHTPKEHKRPFRSLLDDVQTSEFYHPPSPVSLSPLAQGDESSRLPTTSTSETPTTFSSPPLLPSFLSALSRMLGDDAKPTPIQALSIKWLIEESGTSLTSSEWKQFLLASETGTGKSLAYLLPILQKLKLDEQNGLYSPSANTNLKRVNPRAIILAPTHELSRQLSSFAKALGRIVKIRALCPSHPNKPSTTKVHVTAKKLSEQLDAVVGGAGADEVGELDIEKDTIPVDILIGTPMKIMEMIRGRGWDRLQGMLEPDEEGNFPKLRRGRDKMPGVGKWQDQQGLGLENVQWVVVDEADVMFDPDFQEVTRTLLADISAARGKTIQVDAADPSLSSFTPVTSSSTTHEAINYPFNLILTSATIPKNFASYLDTHHPHLIRLTSAHLHHLPTSLQTEHVSWTGDNKYADIERRIRKVWASDAASWGLTDSVSASQAAQRSLPSGEPKLSKILIFCNKNTKVERLAEYLEDKGVKCVALTSSGEQRKRGSNKHLEGFMRPVQINEGPTHHLSSFHSSSSSKGHKNNVKEAALRDPKVTPHVMITTSFLSRGLDFAPEVGHVFIVDEPRNMMDFLHRAGRSGRAGQKGKVVIFTKLKGRGSARGKEMKERLRKLSQRRGG